VRQIVVRHMVTATVLVVVTIMGISLAGWSPRVEYIAPLGLLLAIATVALRRLGTSIAEWRWPSPVPASPAASGVDPRIAGLETLIHRSIEDDRVFRRRLRVMLADLTTHRLERDHGIDPTEHPDEARQLLGDDAWRVLTADPAATAAGIERAVAAIERLPRLARPT
jgi:hypothetical protein